MQSNMYGTKISDLENTDNNPPQLNQRQMEEIQYKRNVILPNTPSSKAPPHINMDQLVHKICDTLPAKKQIDVLSTDTEESNYVKQKMYIYRYIGEFSIILILFFIMSQSVVRKIIGKYITSINPIDGKVSNVGILIYGIIFAIIFLVVKKFTIDLSIN